MNEINLTPPPAQAEGAKGSLIGSIIVVVILIIGAIYLYAGRKAPEMPITPEVPATEEMGTTTVPEAPLGTSDELNDLEADLNLTDFSDLEADLNSL